MDAIRTELLKAVDGVGGGSYTLTAPLEFDGDSVTFDDDVFIGGTADLTINGNLVVNSIFDFNGQGNFNDDVNVNDRWVFRSGGQTEFKAGNATQFFDLDDLAVIADSHTYRLPLTPMCVTLDGTNPAVPTWFFQLAAPGGFLQIVTNSAAEILFAFPVNEGDVITNITATIRGGTTAGHGGVDPTNKPRLRLYEGGASGSVASYTALATQTDTATGAAYDADHFITISPAYTALDRYYIVGLRGEFGGTAAANEVLLVTIQANVVRNKLVSTNTFGS
jgi:hypothetical protein